MGFWVFLRAIVADGHAYCGFVAVLGREHLMRVSRDEDGIHLEVDRDLERLLSGVQMSIRQRLDRSSDIHEFLVEFNDILERVALGGLADAPPRADAMRCIVEEIEEIGWERVHSVNEQLQVDRLTWGKVDRDQLPTISSTFSRFSAACLSVPLFPSSGNFVCKCRFPSDLP